MKYVAALYTCGGKVVTGCNHGDAFGKLTEREKNSNGLCSGFVDPNTLKFISDECEFYLKKIIMLRHGDSVGEQDSPITDLGRSQAKLAAAFLIKLDLRNYKGFCSPLRRCVETARILEEMCGLQFKPDPRLLKQNTEESNETFMHRVGHILDYLPEKSLLISHCDFIRNMAQLAVGVNITVPDMIPNCSTTYIDNHKAIWIARKHDENITQKDAG